ncbi:TPA: hypothetical protein ACTTVN_000630 [Legionella anisa]|uniref:hypothetical protein n=1 Tax=Legionella anisa TaxID=28082 RepID=UPI0022437323|nr:hypothetical protein [Legionella anisa]MCW8425585.1 hypothetical protein [Legionella anisa]MCW8448985.1 hypothetical protein [Legionella anisa]
MLLSELYEHYGTWTKLSRELGLGNSTYSVWRKQGYIPWKAQCVIENITNRKFIASKEHAEPDLRSTESDIYNHEMNQ